MENWLKVLVAAACCVVILWGASPLLGSAARYLRGVEARQDEYNAAVAGMSGTEQACRNTADDAARHGSFSSKEMSVALHRCYKENMLWPVAKQSLEEAGLWGAVAG